MPDASRPLSDLLIVGAGHLGLRVVLLWRKLFPSGPVLAETRSAARHRQLARAGAAVRLRGDDAPQTQSHVLVALPPSATDDYGGEMDRAVSLWDRAGHLIMVSSTAVYAEQSGGVCQEHSPLTSNARARRLRAAEERVLTAGGSVVRMAGLYDDQRGPHIVYLRTPVSTRRPDGIINLIHYDDAAALCVAALTRGRPEAIYIGCDDEPITRKALVTSAVDSDWYAKQEEPRPTTFSGIEGPLGRRCDNSWTRSALNWSPRHRNFQAGVNSGRKERLDLKEIQPPF